MTSLKEANITKYYYPESKKSNEFQRRKYAKIKKEQITYKLY